MRSLEDIAREAAKEVCPDIGHPLDPNNYMQKQAAAIILSALTEATQKSEAQGGKKSRRKLTKKDAREMAEKRWGKK